MKQEIKISDFLRTGKFGKVEINDSFEAVIEKLGQPNDSHDPELIKPRKSLVYGRYEIFFLGDKLESIQNDRYDPKYPDLTEFENGTFTITSEILKADRKKTMEEVSIELTQLNIEFKVIDYWGRKAIKTIGNVVIDFIDEKWSDLEDNWVKIENYKDFELIGIRYYPLYETDTNY